MDTDRELRQVLLALRQGLIDPVRLAEGIDDWARQGRPSLLEFLTQRGWITPEQCRRLEHEAPNGPVWAVPGGAEAATVTAPEGSATRPLPGPPARDPAETGAYATGRPGGDPTWGEARREGVPRPAADPGGRYCDLRPHRSGGLGRVWRARDRVIGRDVALKELRPDRADQPELRSRFLEEARITGQLEHPSIVPLYDLVADGAGGAAGGPGYTMRFVSGRTLAEATRDYHGRRREGKATALDLTALLDAFVSVCHATAYAHARSVLHRDLKGQNVVLGEFGEVVVLDWGLAKVVGGPAAADPSTPPPVLPPSAREATQPGSISGTPAYMAPEVADGQPASTASDIYALGAMLYVILTGRLSYEGDPSEVLRRVRESAPPRPRSVNPAAPAALEAVCLRAMARDPAARYGSAGELAAEVRRWLADEPVRAYRDPWAVRASRWARRHRTPVIAAAVFLVSAVVALAASTGLVWQEQRRTAAEKQLAEQERARAEANFLLARDLAWGLLDTAEHRLPRVREAEPIRKDMTEAARRTFVQFLRQRPDDPDLRERTAWLCRMLAKIHNNLNETGEADRLYRESIRILEELVDRGAGAPFYRDRLAETLRDHAQVLEKVGRYRDAAAVLRRSADLAGELRSGDAERPAYRRTQGTALLALAGLESLLGRAAESAESARQAAELFRGLLGLPPGEAVAQDPLLLGVALNRRATALRELGRPEDALAVLAEAHTHLRALASRGENNEVQHFLGRVLVERGRSRALLPDRRPQAEGDFDEAIRIWEDLRQRYPAYAQYREWLAVAFTGRGRERSAQGRFDPAGEDLDQARQILEALVRDFPALPGYQVELGRTYLELGRLARARGDAARAADWFAKAGQSLRASLERAPEHALARRDLDEAEAERKRGLPARP